MLACDTAVTAIVFVELETTIALIVSRVVSSECPVVADVGVVVTTVRTVVEEFFIASVSLSREVWDFDDELKLVSSEATAEAVEEALVIRLEV